MNNSLEQPGDSWLEKRGFGGLDWASQKHYVVVVDPQGKVLEDFEIEHSSLGWKKFRERMKPTAAFLSRSRPARVLSSSNCWKPGWKFIP